MLRPDGVSMKAKIKDIMVTSNNEEQLTLVFNNKSYIMRINSTDIDSFVRPDFLLAVLNEYIEGIYLTPNESARRASSSRKGRA